MNIGIIVSYRPNVSNLTSNLKEVIGEVDKIILIENGSDESTQNQIKYAFNDERIIIIFEEQNLGLAKAQNIGIKMGLAMGGEFFLFLDDDSKLRKGSVKELREEFITNSKLGIAACHIIHDNSLKEQKYWVETDFFYKRLGFTSVIRKLENVNTVISSGILISKEVIEACGLMREDYFIDYIDIEYCLRVRANEYTISVIRSAELIHKLGETKSITAGIFHFHPTNHSPERRYYMIRNRIWTWKLYAFQFPGWLLIDLGNFFADNFRVFIFEKNKYSNLKFFIAGLMDGIFKM